MNNSEEAARKRAIEKIEKCLKMAQDGRGNETEMSNALRQAQALMKKWGVSEEEVGLIGYGLEAVHTTIQASRGGKTPVTLNVIIALVMHAFGVKAVIERRIRKTDFNYTVIYAGPKHRIILAAYTHVVIAKAVERDWKEFLQRRPMMKGSAGARAGFYQGWVGGVVDKVQAFAIPDDEQRQMEQHLNSQFPDAKPQEKNKQKTDSRTRWAGFDASEDFQLHRPVGNK